MSLEAEFANLTAAVVRLATGVERMLALAPGAAAAPQVVPESTAVAADAPQATTPPPSPPPAAEPVAPTAGPTPTLDDCKAAAKAMAGAFDQATGRANTIAVLSRFGASKMPEVKPEHYAEFIALCQSVQAGGQP